MSRENESDNMRQYKKIVKLAATVIIALVLLGIFFSAMVIIPSGTKGVVTTFGQITGTMNEGLNWRNPFIQNVAVMNIAIQKVETSEAAASKDLQDVMTGVTINYRIEEAYIIDIYRDLREDYENRVIVPNIEECVKAITAQFTAEELILKRSEVKIKFADLLQERLNVYHIDILTVSITNFEFSKVFTEAIEAKVTAEQKAFEAKKKAEMAGGVGPTTDIAIVKNNGSHKLLPQTVITELEKIYLEMENKSQLDVVIDNAVEKLSI